jgi:adenine-specific DNA-methyltransferase
MIKYLGSKRRLVGVIGDLASGAGARTALDLFTGTTRIAQELKRRGCETWAVDIATYSEVLAQCYVATDAAQSDLREVGAILDELAALPGRRGYFTRVFCEESRYFQPKNGMRVDAIRDTLQDQYRHCAVYPILLTSLMLAADRVDSTTGMQMAYLKQWAPRGFNDLELRVPDLVAGTGHAVRGDAATVARTLPLVDFAYLDPPYNQHRYFTNYHIWETLVRWDAPDHYGIACKRADSRDESTKSPYNSPKTMPGALAAAVAATNARLVAISYNNEAWLSAQDISQMCDERECVEVLEFDSRRYVGAQIGIHNLKGDKVGTVSHLTNTELVLVAGDRDAVRAAVGRAARSAQQTPVG